MLRLIDCSIEECIERNRDRYIYVFGAGGNILFFESSDLRQLKDNVKGVLDNGAATSVKLFGTDMPIRRPESLREAGKCSVIITTSVYMIEMYEQLAGLALPEDVEVYVYPLMTLRNDHLLTAGEKDGLFHPTKERRIPKVIHSFWFSGSEKPESYQRCIDSWKRHCPDYEIREYNLTNYDTGKHPFLQKAIEVGAWAYATDFARLDVLSQEGGIYMDMDVELLKPMDFLLHHEGVFSFYSDGGIDLAAFMSVSGNPLLKEVLRLYDDVSLPDTKKGFERFFQPLYALPAFQSFGVKMNGSFQSIDDNLFLPRYLMMPLDVTLYERNDNEDTIMIHHANAGWKEDSYGAKKAERNRAFFDRLVKGCE